MRYTVTFGPLEGTSGKPPKWARLAKVVWQVWRVRSQPSAIVSVSPGAGWYGNATVGTMGDPPCFTLRWIPTFAPDVNHTREPAKARDGATVTGMLEAVAPAATVRDSEKLPTLSSQPGP
jgi:hypothetical protein